MGIVLQENSEPCRDHIVFSFEKEKVDQVVNEIVKRIGKNHTIKGFRKGKAPPQAIKTVAKDAILGEASQRLMNEAFQDILFETKLKPFGDPEVSKVDISYTGFTVDMKFSYVPKFDLSKYKDFSLEEPKDLPNQEDLIKHTVADLCRQHPVLRPYGEEDFVVDGDSVVVEYTSLMDGAEFPHSAASGVVVEMGNGSFIRDFEINIMGMKPGEKREFDITFPEDANNKTIAGKTIHFVTTVTSGVKKDPPVYDEEFAKKLGHASLEELNKKILDHAKMRVESIRKNALKKAVFDNLLESNTIEVPEWMVLKSAQAISASKNLKWEENTQEVKDHFLSEGLKTLKLSMMFDRIRELEVETVLTPEEIQGTLQKNIGYFPPEVQRTLFDKNNTGHLARLYSEIQDEQVFEWIIKNSNVTTVETKQEQSNG